MKISFQVKFRHSQDNIQFFGWINFPDKILRNADIYDHINKMLDNRALRQLMVTAIFSDPISRWCSAVRDFPSQHKNRAKPDGLWLLLQKIVDVVAANSEKFYIRAQRCASL